jgi:hypothetical protein
MTLQVERRRRRPNQLFVNRNECEVRDIVKRTATETGDEDFRHVSSHDLRYRFVRRLLVDKRVNPRIIMAVGR